MDSEEYQLNTVYIVGGDPHYGRMFFNRGWVVVDSIEDADLVQFTGGEDVSPHLYNERVHPRTYHNSQRDLEEQKVFYSCIDLRIPMAGICRGGQFLNVMCGGKMYQHVDGHAIGGTHPMIYLPTGKMIQVSSTHHQMMRPGPGAEVLGVASESKYYENMEGFSVLRHEVKERGEDIECIRYPHFQVLCYQPHPEYMDDSECQQLYFDMIQEMLCAD